MPGTPPPYGFHPDYIPGQGVPPHGYIPPQNISGINLSYPMPMPGQFVTTYPSPPIEEVEHKSSESSSDSDSGGSYRLDYTQYAPIGYAWQFISSFDDFPHSKAVRAGQDQDGSPIYVGRAMHEGDMLPAKIIPYKDAAYVSYNGEEVEKSEFEILRTGDFCWEFASGGVVPDGAVEIGRTADGERLYMGRCLHEGSQTPGKVQASHGCLYIPFCGQEISYTDYEVLVVK